MTAQDRPRGEGFAGFALMEAKGTPITAAVPIVAERLSRAVADDNIGEIIAAKTRKAIEAAATIRALEAQLADLRRSGDGGSVVSFPAKPIRREERRVLISQAEVLRRLGINAATLYRWRKAGKFPEPVLGPSGRMLGYFADEFETWLADRERGKPAGPPPKAFETRRARRAAKKLDSRMAPPAARPDIAPRGTMSPRNLPPGGGPVMIGGRIKLTDLARLHGLPYEIVLGRWLLGWPMLKVLRTPVNDTT
jgi:predicted DNA-binding transcriptional regulator AlpA